MQQTFGDFIKMFPPDHDSLELSFTSKLQPLKHQWCNQRLSAYFVADYFANLLPLDKHNPEEEQRIQEIKGAISYVSNELLENAMKFNLENSNYRIRFGIHFLEDSELIAVIFTMNTIDYDKAKHFQGFIQKLLNSDPEELYLQQVEKSAEDDNSEMSGLGFLTMINDYQVKLGWRFQAFPSEPEVLVVTTMAQITV